MEELLNFKEQEILIIIYLFNIFIITKLLTCL